MRQRWWEGVLYQMEILWWDILATYKWFFGKWCNLRIQCEVKKINTACKEEISNYFYCDVCCVGCFVLFVLFCFYCMLWIVSKYTCRGCWVVIVGFVDFVVLLVSKNAKLFCICFPIVNNCKLFVALFCIKEVLFFEPICGWKSVNFLLFFLTFGTHLIKNIEPNLFFLYSYSCSLFLSLFLYYSVEDSTISSWKKRCFFLF